MSDFDEVVGNRMLVRIRFSITEDDKQQKRCDVLKAFEQIGIRHLTALWIVNAVEKYTLEIGVGGGKFTGATAVSLVEALAQYSDADNANIEITNCIDMPVIQARWFEGNLTMLELHPQLWAAVPYGERGPKFWLDLLFNHVWNAHDPIIDSTTTVLPREEVRQRRVKTLVNEANRVLKSMDCMEIDTEQLEAALLPFIQPKWSKQ